MVLLRWECGDVLMSSSITLHFVCNSSAAAIPYQTCLHPGCKCWLMNWARIQQISNEGAGDGKRQKINVIYAHHLHLWPKAEARSWGPEELDSAFNYTSEAAKAQFRWYMCGVPSQSDLNKKKIPSKRVDGPERVTSPMCSNGRLIKLVTEPLQTGEWSHWSGRLSYGFKPIHDSSLMTAASRRNSQPHCGKQLSAARIKHWCPRTKEAELPSTGWSPSN